MKNKKKSFYGGFLVSSVIVLSSATTFSSATVVATSLSPLCHSQPACTNPPCRTIEAKAKVVAREILTAYKEAENSIAQDYRDKIVSIKEEIKKLALEIDIVTAQLEMLERDNIMTMKEIIKESVRSNQLEATESFSKDLKK